MNNFQLKLYKKEKESLCINYQYLCYFHGKRIVKLKDDQNLYFQTIPFDIISPDDALTLNDITNITFLSTQEQNELKKFLVLL